MPLPANSGGCGALYKEIFLVMFVGCFGVFFVRGERGRKDYTLENYSVTKNNFEENGDRSNSHLIVLYFSFL